MNNSPHATTVNLLEFVSTENENFLVSLANNREDLQISSRLQGLYAAAMETSTIREVDIPIYQLLTFTHYHFLYSSATLMRCHLSEAFSSARTAIDAALIAAQIIHDRESQAAYAARDKPFDKLARHYRNLIRDSKPLPSPHIPELLRLHDLYSTFASHADIKSFVHRVRVAPSDGGSALQVGYFQFSRDDDERQIHALGLFSAFVIILDVFSGFLIEERKAVPVEWRHALIDLGKKMNARTAELRQNIAARGGEGGPVQNKQAT